jgi:hypothetical protein
MSEIEAVSIAIDRVELLEHLINLASQCLISEFDYSIGKAISFP